MAKKVDFSRLVQLDLCPSEAAVLLGFLLACADRLEPGAETAPIAAVVADCCHRLVLQLKVLRWRLPGAEDARKAPWPV